MSADEFSFAVLDEALGELSKSASAQVPGRTAHLVEHEEGGFYVEIRDAAGNTLAVMSPSAYYALRHGSAR